MSSATIKGISFGIFSLVYMELLQEAKKIYNQVANYINFHSSIRYNSHKQSLLSIGTCRIFPPWSNGHIKKQIHSILSRDSWKKMSLWIYII